MRSVCEKQRMCEIAAYTVASYKDRDADAVTVYRFVQVRRRMNRNQKPVKIKKSRGEEQGRKPIRI